jgi:hypothetical protein
LDVNSASVKFASTITESSAGADAVATGAILGSVITESATGADSIQGRKLWEEIDDSQTANWQNISSNQTPSWSNINTAQTPNWTPIST